MGHNIIIKFYSTFWSSKSSRSKYYLQKLQDLRSVKPYNNKNYQYNNKDYDSSWKKSNFIKISSEILSSDRLNNNQDSSEISLIADFFEELGTLIFNKVDFSRLCSFIVEYAVNENKELEKTSLKSYLESSEFSNIVRNIYKEELLKTYKSILDSGYDELKSTFVELLKLQNKITADTQLEDAEVHLAENMDNESFERFLKLKKDSLI